MSNFEIGMIVRLKTGGPKMTIVGVAGRDESGHCTMARCLWIDENMARRAEAFDVHIIEELVVSAPKLS